MAETSRSRTARIAAEVGAFVSVSVTLGDCMAVLAARDGPLFDCCVTDPPYHLTSMSKPRPDLDGKNNQFARRQAQMSTGFMGKEWDGGDVAFRPELWRAVFDQMKPGAYLISFSGCRTYHKMASAIEEAGFEIREMCSWVFGSGFPKSRNVFKDLANAGLACTCTKSRLSSHNVTDENLLRLREALDAHKSVSSDEEHNLRADVFCQKELASENGANTTAQSSVCHLWGTSDSPSAIKAIKEGERPTVLQQPMLGIDQIGTHAANIPVRLGEHNSRGQGEGGNARGQKPGVEGRRLPQKTEGELSGGEVPASAGMGATDGENGRLYNAASLGDGANVRIPDDTHGSGQSHRPQPVEQSSEQSGDVADERGSQAWGGWPVCDGCCKPIIPEGLGSALKPAHEPICLARKPLSEKSIAANVVKHGTGAINVDACRVEGVPPSVPQPVYGIKPDGVTQFGAGTGRNGERSQATGRWPANILHDGSDEVTAAFPETGAASCADKGGRPSMRGIMSIPDGGVRGHDDNGGSASRFFYSAKAGPLDRLGSPHPTVKPVDVMRWLVRLVTPPGGLILDPFAGSGTTGIAAMAEGFDCELIDLMPDHVADIERKLAFLRGEGRLTVQEHINGREARKDASASALPILDWLAA